MKKPTRKARPASAAPMPAATARSPTYDDLLAIARLIESGSRFSEFRLRSGDIEVEVKRANGIAAGPQPAPQVVAGGEIGALTPVATPPEARARSAEDPPAGTKLIRSPMVGTFYRSPQPGAPPFIEPGSKVEPETILCVIEVMKLMNSITAGISGVVTHVLVENAHPVEAGQPLIVIRPT